MRRKTFMTILGIAFMVSFSSCSGLSHESAQDSNEESSLTSELGSYSYADTSDSPVDNISHGEATLDKLEFILADDGMSYSVRQAEQEIRGDVVIPPTYQGLPVTTIAQGGFWCDEIVSIYIPKGVTCIKEQGIYSCEKLKSVYIPETVNSIGIYAMTACPKLEVIVSDKNPFFSSMKGALYNKDKTELICAPNYIKTFSFPKTVRRIGYYAFYKCENLESIIIPEGVTSIGAGAFSGAHLNQVYISKTVETIGEFAFGYCSFLAHVDFCYDGESHESHLTSIGKDAFEHCPNLREISLPDHVETIGESAFHWCRNVKSLSLSKELVTIEDEAFSGMESIKKVTIPNRVKSIGETAFEECPSLEEIEVDTGNPYFSSFDGALYNKDKTTFMKCPEGKTSIRFPESLVHFLEKACSNSALKSVIIPETVESLSDWLFCDCKSLAHVTLPKTISVIPVRAFADCIALTSFKIESNIKEIGRGAFNFCVSLESVEIQNGVTIVGYGAFDDCRSLKSVSFPDSVVEVGYNCFWGCYSLESVAFGSGIKKIEGYAFAECTSLSSMTYNGTIEDWSKVNRGGAWGKHTLVTSIACSDGDLGVSELELMLGNELG